MDDLQTAQSSQTTGGNAPGPEQFIEQLPDLEAVPDPNGWIRILIIVLIVAAVAGLIWLIVMQLRRSSAQRGEQQLLPHEAALQRLQKALEIIHQPREFVIEVSDALRQYLEDRFRIAAPEQTTEEFVHAMRNDPQLDPHQKEALQKFLNTSDLVKFAKVEPGRHELMELFDTARDVVSQTAYEPLDAESADNPPAERSVSGR